MSAVLLAGLRASGKSTLAPLLSQATDVACADLDDLTRDALGCATVREAWDTHGEPAFRAAELDQLRGWLAGRTGGVIALGGGTPMIDGFAGLLGDGAVMVYLHAAPGVLRARMADGDPDRPSLTGASALDEVESVYAVRDPVYRGLAAHVVDAEDRESAVLSRLLAVLA